VLTDTTEHYPLLDQLPRSMCQAVSKPVYTRKLYRAVMHLLGNDPLAMQSPVPQRSQALRVLCVDDHLVNLKLLEAFLGDIGVTTLLATSGEEALELLTEQKVDLIFMDVQMPGMDGRQTPADLRLPEEIAGFSPVPIVALTAHALNSERHQLLQCGMNDYLTKPITTEQLRQSLNKWTGLMPANQSQPALPSPDARTPPPRYIPKTAVGAPQPPRQQPTLKIIDPEESLRLAAGKEDLARDIMKMLLDGLPQDHRSITEALEREDWSNLRELIHKLHGATRYCGVPELRAQCQAAETLLKKG